MKRILPGLAVFVLCSVMSTVSADLTNDFSRGLLDRSGVLAVAKTITSEAFPNADDVLVDEFIREEYVADGRSVTWDDEYLKVLTEKLDRARELERAFEAHVPRAHVALELAGTDPEKRYAVAVLRVHEVEPVLVDDLDLHSLPLLPARGADGADDLLLHLGGEGDAVGGRGLAGL